MMPAIFSTRLNFLMTVADFRRMRISAALTGGLGRRRQSLNLIATSFCIATLFPLPLGHSTITYPGGATWRVVTEAATYRGIPQPGYDPFAAAGGGL